MKKRNHLKGYFAVIAAVCVLTVSIVPAMAAETHAVCGIEEHIHSQACYTESSKLVCGLNESAGHSHSDSCYTSSSSLVCGQAESEEHTHGSSCYQTSKALTCGITETAGHTHSGSCYESSKTLTCQKPEHTHSTTCYAGNDSNSSDHSGNTGNSNPGDKSETEITPDTENSEELDDTETPIDTEIIDDSEMEEVPADEDDEKPEEGVQKGDPTADLEGPRIWNSSVSRVKLTGNKGTDLVNIALSQLGNRESTRNYIVNPQGEKKGYSRYGAWYGLPYNDWCAMFVCFCLNYAHISQSEMPWSARCEWMVNALRARGKYEVRGSYEPHPGDLVFFDRLKTGIAEHIGIVYQVGLTTDKDGRKVASSITTIEGNSGNMVCTHTYSANDKLILGYGRLEDEHNLTQTTETDDCIVTAAYEEYAAIPSNAKLSVEEIDPLILVELSEKEMDAIAGEVPSDGVFPNGMRSRVAQQTTAAVSNPQYAAFEECYKVLTGESMDHLIHVGLKVDGQYIDTGDKVTYTITWKESNQNPETFSKFIHMNPENATLEGIMKMKDVLGRLDLDDCTAEEYAAAVKLRTEHELIPSENKVRFMTNSEEFIGR